MSKGDHLGEFELLVLSALLRLGDDAYGVAIRAEIEERAGRNASIGAVYATLERLEKKGLIRSRMGEATPERGGRASDGHGRLPRCRLPFLPTSTRTSKPWAGSSRSSNTEASPASSASGT